MKKIFTLSAIVVMILVSVVSTSCSSTKSSAKAFAKSGYIMGELQPGEQLELYGLGTFPVYPQTALGYLPTANSITFVYEQDDYEWNTYTQSLLKRGFSNVANGYVKADKSKGVTYNVSTKTVTIYKRDYRLVTFAWAEF